ncbi:MAG: SRPBCC family protein, partial [Limisphaerales bacterium]
TVADILCSMQLSEEEVGAIRSVRRSVSIRKSPQELYQFWRNFENLPNFMSHLQSVQVTGNRSSWVAKGPAGSTVKWDAEIVDDQPNYLIAWQSLPGADVDNWGTIKFEPAQNGKETIVQVELGYTPPAGAMGAIIAKLFGEAPEQTVKEDLRRFKQLMETGEIPTTEGQPAGRATSATKYEKQIRSMANA